MSRKFSRVKAVAARYGNVDTATIWRWVNQGILPKPYKIGPNVTAWADDELDERDARIVAERDQHAAA